MATLVSVKKLVRSLLSKMKQMEINKTHQLKTEIGTDILFVTDIDTLAIADTDTHTMALTITP
jgi:hypothetical protein